MTKVTAADRKHFLWRSVIAAATGVGLVGALGVFLFASSVVEADEPTLFSDGFESGDFDSWTSADEPWATPAHAPSAYTGTYKASVSETHEDASLTKKVSTEDHEDLTLSYWYNITHANALEEDDHVYVEWYDGEEWNQLADYTDMSTEGWTEASHELPESADDNENFEFRFRADLGSSSDEFRLDDVELTAGEFLEFGSIHAFKFHDMDGDGEYNEEDGDTPIEGWEICLYRTLFINKGGSVDSESEDCKFTDATGWVWWMDIELGDYVLIEEERDTWFPTSDYEYEEVEVRDGTARVYLEEEGEVIVEFGNTQYAIHALKFDDKNGNGWRDEGESTIKGWKMCLISDDDLEDINLNFLKSIYADIFGEDWDDVFDDEEDFLFFMIMNGYVEEADCRLTDENGWVWWMGLNDDSYLVIEEQRDNWFPTTDYEDDGVEVQDGFAWVNLGEEEEINYVVEIEFGNVNPAIHVLKFWDKNNNGDRDEEEPVLSGWSICLFRILFIDKDEFLEPVGECQFTDVDGWVWWMDLEPGDYLISEEAALLARGGTWVPTNTRDGTWGLELDREERIIELGNTTQSIHAQKFFDQGEGGPAIRNWEICLQRLITFDKGSPRFDPEFGERCETTDFEGWVWWMSLEPGLYLLEEMLPEGWFSTNTEDGSKLVELVRSSVSQNCTTGS